MRVALILVHYRTPELLPAAVAALHADAADLGGVDLVIVDNGSDPDDRSALAALGSKGATVIDPGRNLGFAGGVNLGAASTKGEVFVVLNPDVLVQPGCLPSLVRELTTGAGAAGPRFFWDPACSVLLPPTERVGRVDELSRALAEAGPGWRTWARRRWRAHARRHWRATQALTSSALSGGLLAIRRDAWERVGPFDEGYPLYFEETDWLTRARRAGVVARYVPAARAVHLHGESARREPRAQAWFEEGARRFRRKHYGVWFERWLSRLARPAAAAPPLFAAALDLGSFRDRAELWIEISPRALGFPAAAERLAHPLPSSWTVPMAIRPRMLGGAWYARAVDGAGVELLNVALRAES